jgi:hypothetical protein
MAASTDWVTYYRSNRTDGGTIEAPCLYGLDDGDLTGISKGCVGDPDGLRNTIAGSGGGVILLIPGKKGIFHILHQGFATMTRLGGEQLAPRIYPRKLQQLPLQGIGSSFRCDRQTGVGKGDNQGESILDVVPYQ